ncbi:MULTISPECIES: MFS transporter [Nocardiaceae]|uniref:MFS family permease n=1 Tax=Rhodococcoides corynebacterioides TaxID=53972 RepID=A0ABS2KNR3_9NOCA|nr:MULTISPECIES: MFS transporter [Rhodococcus]MBM7413448.1 MFS family permease [Rhodococcus corynebacterioides]MBP1115911.1 MFS family permease [Rhodococcus sp. PvP016]
MFALMVTARTIAWFGSAVALVAFPLIVYRDTGSASATALLTAVETTPYLLFGLFAGAAADRWRRRPTMVITAVIACVAVASVPAADAVGTLSTPHLFVAAFAGATAMVFFDAAGFGLLPALVPRDRLADAVGRQTATATAITMAGPAVGGALVAAASPMAASILNAVTFAVAAVMLARVREPASPARSTPPDLWRDIAEGVRFIRRHPLVRLLTLIGTGNSVAGGIMTGLLVATAVQRYGVDEDGGQLGLFFTALGVGTLISTVLLPRLSRRVTAGTIAIAGLSVQAAAITVWILCTSSAPGLGALVVFQTASSTVILNGITVRHLVTPDHLQGRVNTTARMLAWGGQPIGAGLAGALVGPFGLVPTLASAVAVVAVGAVAAALSSLREVSAQLYADADA